MLFSLSGSGTFYIKLLVYNLITIYYPSNVIKTSAETLPESTLRIFPNPSRGSLTLEGLSTDNKTSIAVYSIDGRLIMSRITKLATEQIDLGNQSPGTYLLKVNKQTLKILKEE